MSLKGNLSSVVPCKTQFPTTEAEKQSLLFGAPAPTHSCGSPHSWRDLSGAALAEKKWTLLTNFCGQPKSFETLLETFLSSVPLPSVF